MSPIIMLSIMLLASFSLQALLGFRQMKHFGAEYTKMRKEGRVAIGRRSGKLTSGTIVMFSLDKKGTICYGRLLQGTTILAKFKNFNRFNDMNIDSLTLNSVEMKKEIKITRKAIMDAVNNYQLVINGQPIPEKKAPISKLLSGFKR